MSLPTDDKARKAIPIFRGVLMYFPDALLAVAEVSRVGNDQHNPGQSLHWAREKSTEQMDTSLRHQMDHGAGVLKDTDGTWHLAKAIWRLCAELQLTIERKSAEACANRRSVCDDSKTMQSGKGLSLYGGGVKRADFPPAALSAENS